MGQRFEPLKNDLILRTARGTTYNPPAGMDASNSMLRGEGGPSADVGDAAR